MRYKKEALLKALDFWGREIILLMKRGRLMDTEVGDAIDAIGCKLMPELFRVTKKLEEE